MYHQRDTAWAGGDKYPHPHPPSLPKKEWILAEQEGFREARVFFPYRSKAPAACAFGADPKAHFARWNVSSNILPWIRMHFAGLLIWAFRLFYSA